ncbi:hypothetical protein L9F63_008458, partial [Diploptera punctata]
LDRPNYASPSISIFCLPSPSLDSHNLQILFHADSRLSIEFFVKYNLYEYVPMQVGT